jgi:hypothetical protein
MQTIIRNEFKIEIPASDEVLWGFGVIVYEWTCLENELDLWVYTANGSEVPNKDGKPVGFKSRVRLLKEIVQAEVLEPHKTEFVSTIDGTLGMQFERDRLVHWLWGDDGHGNMGVTDWRKKPQMPEWNFDLKKLVGIAKKIDGFRARLMHISLQNGEKDGLILQSVAWQRISGKPSRPQEAPG